MRWWGYYRDFVSCVGFQPIFEESDEDEEQKDGEKDGGKAV